MLLVSDWDQDGEDILDNCDVADRPSSHSDHGYRDYSRCDSVDTLVVGIQEDDENDVLMVDDYNPDVEEEVEFEVLSSPVATGGDETGVQEVRVCKEYDGMATGDIQGERHEVLGACRLEHASR